ncbi:MAG: GumC family protein [Vampirovibrionales bacterium]
MATTNIVELAKRQQPILLGGVFVSVAMIWIYVLLFYLPMYKSSTEIYIRSISNENVLSNFGSSNPVKSESTFSNPLFNYQSILESEKLSTRVFEKIKAKYPNDLDLLGIKDTKDWYAYYSKNLESRVIASTDILKSSFSWPTQENAEPVLALLVQEYKKLNLDIQKSTVSEKSFNAEEQLERVTEKLEALRTKIKDYREGSHSVDLDQERSDLTASRVRLQQDFESIQSEISFNTSKMNELQRLLNFKDVDSALVATSLGRDPLIMELSTNLAQAEQRLSKLQAQFTDAYPEVQTAKEEVKSLKRTIAERSKQTPHAKGSKRRVYDEGGDNLVQQMALARVEQKALTAKKNELLNGINHLKGFEGSIPEKQRYLDELLKQEDVLKNAYTKLSDSSMESLLKDKGLIDNLFVLSSPSEGEPEKTKLYVNLLGFLLFGVFLGLATAWTKEKLEDKWNTPSELMSLSGLDLLGSLSQASKTVNLYQDWLKVDADVFREYALIVSNLVQESSHQQASVIGFLSTDNEEKESNIVGNIALNASVSQQSVLLIDTNLNAKSTHFPNLKLKNTDLLTLVAELNKGHRLKTEMSDLEFQELLEQCVTKITIPGSDTVLHYLGIYQPLARTYDVVASYAFEQLLDRLRQSYNLILVDTPSAPVEYPETKTVLAKVDSTVLLTSHKSKKTAFLKTVSFMVRNKFPLLGLIPGVVQPEDSKQTFKR